jgi:hypothetical protein
MELGFVFAINKRIMHRICRKEIRNFEVHNDHHYLPGVEQENQIIEYIIASFHCDYPISLNQIRISTHKILDNDIPRRWFCHSVHRHTDRFEHVISYQQANK